MENDKENINQSPRSISEQFIKKLKEQNFDSEADMKAFMDNAIGKTVADVFPTENKNWEEMTQKEQVESLLEQARQARNNAKIVELAEKIITIDPDCSEAYHMLGDYKATEAKGALEWYKKALDAGKRQIGEQNFEEYKGHFWGFHETRPFMRAKQAYADALLYVEKKEEAVTQLKEMLELNPGDNQGVRYLYGAQLIIMRRFNEFEKLLAMFPDEGGAAWAFNKALYLFATKGVAEASTKALIEAHKSNQYVLPLLTGQKSMPESLPSFYSPGQENEAQYYIGENAEAWTVIPNALEWVYEIFTRTRGLKKSRVRSRNRKVKTKKRR